MEENKKENFLLNFCIIEQKMASMSDTPVMWSVNGKEVQVEATTHEAHWGM